MHQKGRFNDRKFPHQRVRSLLFNQLRWSDPVNHRLLFSPPETWAGTPERSDTVRSSQDGGLHNLQMNLAGGVGFGANAIPWFKQILKVIVLGLKPSWAGRYKNCQSFF